MLNVYMDIPLMSKHPSKPDTVLDIKGEEWNCTSLFPDELTGYTRILEVIDTTIAAVPVLEKSGFIAEVKASIHTRVAVLKAKGVQP